MDFCSLWLPGRCMSQQKTLTHIMPVIFWPKKVRVQCFCLKKRHPQILSVCGWLGVAWVNSINWLMYCPIVWPQAAKTIVFKEKAFTNYDGLCLPGRGMSQLEKLARVIPHFFGRKQWKNIVFLKEKASIDYYRLWLSKRGRSQI